MKTWQLQEAKGRLSELVREAQKGGPQAITVRGVTEAVVLSKSAYERLRKGKPSFLEFMRASPLVGVNLKLERDKSLTRDLDL